jgi:hypothetical protein
VFWVSCHTYALYVVRGMQSRHPHLFCAQAYGCLNGKRIQTANRVIQNYAPIDVFGGDDLPNQLRTVGIDCVVALEEHTLISGLKHLPGKV